MYEIFLKLLEEKGVTSYKVAKETGIGNSTFTDWKKGRSAPKHEKLEKIADYFGVSVDYLMKGEELQFTVEMADIDTKLFLMGKRIKEYAIKLSELSDADKEFVMQMIDKLSVSNK